MVKMTDPVKHINSYYDYYAFEVLSEEDIQRTVPRAAEEEEEEEEKEPEKDENGYFIGQKCQCRWKYMKGALYNCEISGRNEDGTYSIVYEDGDEDPFPKIDVERLIQDAWKPQAMGGGMGGGGGFGNPAAGGMFGGQPKPAMGGGMGGGGMGFGNTAAGGSMFGGTGGVINSGNKTLKSENGFGFGFGQRNMYDHDVESVVDTEANSRPAAGGFRFG